MNKGRMEAFSDGVIAIIITIMVLEFHVPHGDHLRDLLPLLPNFLSYALSFLYIGIYWNNHHHMLQAVDTIHGSALWANLNLLFWLSLIPFATAWMGENHFTTWPVVLYGLDLILNALSYTILSLVLIKGGGKDSTLAQATGNDFKGKISIAIYVCGVALAFFFPKVALCLYAAVAIIWFIPDPRIERRMSEHSA
jgi:uncharacterized membrane protein